MWLITTPEVD